MLDKIIKYVHHPAFYLLLGIAITVFFTYLIEKTTPSPSNPKHKNNRQIYKKWHFYVLSVILIIIVYALMNYFNNKLGTDVLTGGAILPVVEETTRSAVRDAANTVISTSQRIFTDGFQ